MMRIALLFGLCAWLAGCGSVASKPDAGPTCGVCELPNATSRCDGETCVVDQCAANYCDTEVGGGCELAIDPQNDPLNCGGCGTVCSSGVCAAGKCTHRVFITNARYPPTFGGVAGADERCNTVAMNNELSGTWKAWLADATGDPSTRLNREGPFVRMDGMTIADDWADLTDGELDVPILLNAGGATPNSLQSWGNVAPDGTGIPNQDCNGWTDATASSFGGWGQNNQTAIWTGYGTSACSEPMGGRHLYCFEQ